jgi:Zn-dependent protease
LCALFALLGIVFGIIALVQIRENRQKGKALAIAGICVGCAWIIGTIAAIVADLPLA